MVSPPPIQLATLGWEDSLILMVLALVVFGPRRLPMIGRQIGKLMYEFRKASNDFKFQMEEELRAAEEADRRKKEEEERQRVAAIAAASQASVSAPAQTVESEAAIGAVEAPTVGSGNSEANPPDSLAFAAETPATSDPSPVIQPPSVGEQVSASRPDYYFEATEPAIAAEVNPEADAAANAEAIQVTEAGKPDPGSAADATIPSAVMPESPNGSGHPGGHDPASGTPSKEPISQHG